MTKAPDHGHRFAVYSPSGMHIGLWGDGKIAADVASESPGNTIEELVTLDHALALVAAALNPWIELRDESRGVTGFHLNGSIAEWDEFDLPETPEDATTALKARDQRIRNEALREVIRICREDVLANSEHLALAIERLITEGNSDG